MGKLHQPLRPLQLVLGGLFFSISSVPLVWAEAGVTEVEIVKYRYQPQVVTIRAGEQVRWINRERRQYHSVKIHRDGSQDALIESDYFFPGDQWSYTFSEPGSYSYLCGPHPEMSGRVEVTP